MNKGLVKLIVVDSGGKSKLYVSLGSVVVGAVVGVGVITAAYLRCKSKQKRLVATAECEDNEMISKDEE